MQAVRECDREGSKLFHGPIADAEKGKDEVEFLYGDRVGAVLVVEQDGHHYTDRQ